MPKQLQRTDENQTRCWISDQGHVWISWHDDLPSRVRERLRTSQHNLCPACLVTIFVGKVRKRHPEYSNEQALFAGIEIMEDLVEMDFQRRERAR
jgi:hypothetical protein